MGWVVDTFGQADSMATIFGTALTALGAVPVAKPGRSPENLTAGMLVVIPALLISGIVLLAGSRHLPREMALMLAKLRAVPSRRRPGGANPVDASNRLRRSQHAQIAVDPAGHSDPAASMGCTGKSKRVIGRAGLFLEQNPSN